MSERARLATSLLAAAAIAAIVALLALGAAAGRRAATGCGAATDHAYLTTSFTVARGISVGERLGEGVRRAVATVEGDTVLANAVAADDVAAATSEVRALVYNHEHIVRLAVLRNGVVLDDLGGPLVLSPVRGTLHLAGRTVGTFELSVQDDAGYRKLAERLTGAHVVIRYRGATIMSDIAVGAGPLPARGTVTLGGVRYLVASFTDGHFPAGTLHIWLLYRAPAAMFARRSCAQVSADVLAGVARRAYDESLSGPPVLPALETLTLDRALPQELAAGDYAGVPKVVAGIVAGGGFARLRVFSGGRLVGDAGGPIAAIAPLRRSIRDAAGSVVGTALFAVQSAHGYWILARSLTGVPVLVRAGARRLAGSFPGPSRMPASGPLRYRGVRYTVASFDGVEFPSGRIEIYVLDPRAAAPPIATTESAGSATRTRPPDGATRQRSSVGARATTASTRAGADASSVTQRVVAA
jgi:hypothetical protein